jgi:hypothetical protein
MQAEMSIDMHVGVPLEIIRSPDVPNEPDYEDIVGFRDQFRAIVAKYSPAVRAYMEIYAFGTNRWLRDRKIPLLERKTLKGPMMNFMSTSQKIMNVVGWMLNADLERLTGYIPADSPRTAFTGGILAQYTAYMRAFTEEFLELTDKYPIHDWPRWARRL